MLQRAPRPDPNGKGVKFLEEGATSFERHKQPGRKAALKLIPVTRILPRTSCNLINVSADSDKREREKNFLYRTKCKQVRYSDYIHYQTYCKQNYKLRDLRLLQRCCCRLSLQNAYHSSRLNLTYDQV
jgi:hypothetical protein